MKFLYKIYLNDVSRPFPEVRGFSLEGGKVLEADIQRPDVNRQTPPIPSIQ